HFAAKIRAPSAGVPLPDGRPVPSGRTLISQAAMSAGLIGFPRFGDWLNAALEPRKSVSTKNAAALRVYMFHLPGALNGPTGDGIVVLARKCRHRGNLCGLTTRSHELSSGWLSVSGIIPCTAL